MTRIWNKSKDAFVKAADIREVSIAELKDVKLPEQGQGSASVPMARWTCTYEVRGFYSKADWFVFGVHAHRPEAVEHVREIHEAMEPRRSA